MKWQTFFIMIFIMYILAGCQALESPTVPANVAIFESKQTATVTPSPFPPTTTLKPLLTGTPKVTATVRINPTKTVTPTPTSTATPSIPREAQMEYRCLEMFDKWPENTTSRGVLILKNDAIITEGVYKGRVKNEIYSLNMANGDYRTLNFSSDGTYETQIYHAFSPAHLLMAYESVLRSGRGDPFEEIIKESLIVATADGQPLVAVPFDEKWYAIVDWLDNERLVIRLHDDTEMTRGNKPASLLVLNPFTGEQRILKPSYPKIFDEPSNFDWEFWSITMYDPTLSRVAYLGYADPGVQYLRIYLRDIEQQRTLGEVVYKAQYPRYMIPRWSEDGSGFLFEGFNIEKNGYELFLVSRDGKIEQLTTLSAFNNAYLRDYIWSPSGDTIAAWLLTPQLDEKKKAELVIIDKNTRQVTHTCLQITYGGEWGGNLFPPIWSPDGKQLVVFDWYDKDHSRVILVDLVKGFAVEIAQNQRPLGWMIQR